MHIGNLRTALYAYLFAKAKDGDFLLRIEDTDRARYVSDAVKFIQDTLAAAHIVPDEGPDIGGPVAPYWDFAPHFFRYIERTSRFLSQGKPGAETARRIDRTIAALEQGAFDDGFIRAVTGETQALLGKART